MPSGYPRRGTRSLEPSGCPIPATAPCPTGSDAYFRDNLERLTGGRRDRPLVFFCEPDCWMSWNAALRAVEYGYTAVRYYPDGAAGWANAGLKLTPLQPVPGGVP